MSNAVLPTFPGLAWNVARKPQWSTVTKTSVSGREFRAAQYSYPIWRYKLTYEVLRASGALPEMQQLAAFFNARGGSWDTWLYSDPDDCAVTAQQFGMGDGLTKNFQLVRAFGGFTEPVFDVDTTQGLAQIYVAGALKAKDVDYVLSQSGMVVFVVPPANGAAITWSGRFYWRCRFLQDQLEFNQFLKQLWDLKTLEFTTVKP